ncbi:hypothetical protein AB0283_03350 [Micromonospora vinacea]|uniref:hypothetical protein n=1 Tax=Micromonospora vinacea TaxID=709878 RepID=UPI00344CC547
MTSMARRAIPRESNDAGTASGEVLPRRAAGTASTASSGNASAACHEEMLATSAPVSGPVAPTTASDAATTPRHIRHQHEEERPQGHQRGRDGQDRSYATTGQQRRQQRLPRRDPPTEGGHTGGRGLFPGTRSARQVVEKQGRCGNPI